MAGNRLHHMIERVHIHLGLLNFTILVVFGLVGLHAVTTADPRTAPAPQGEHTTKKFEVEPNATDRQVADAVLVALAIPHAGKIPDWALTRGPDHVLALEFFSANGTWRVRVLEERGELDIVHHENSMGTYLDAMHAMVLPYAPRTFVMTMWSAYVELSIFSLLFMVLSGIYMWLMTRPRVWWAAAAFTTGTGSFLGLYLATR